MGAMAEIVSTHMISNIWTVMVGSAQLSLYNMTYVVTTTNNSVKTALQAIQVDIIRKVWWVIRNIPINIYFFHVYVHQDNSVNFNELTKISQLNMMCDNTVKQELHQWISDRVNPTPWKPYHTYLSLSLLNRNLWPHIIIISGWWNYNS